MILPFSNNQVFMLLDFETYSEADLKKVGAYEYSMHHSTEIICVSWALFRKQGYLKRNDIHSWAPALEDGFNSGLSNHFSEFITSIMDSNTVLVAHNALFDRLILNNVFVRYMKSMKAGIQAIPTKRWLCTAALASARALPRSLEGACSALNLPIQKDKIGNRLIMKWCKPKKASKKDPSLRHSDRDELLRLIEYCENDIEATAGLFRMLPLLNPTERAVWMLDQAINMRGFAVDRELVHAVLKMIEEETRELDDEAYDLTLGSIDSARQRGEVLKWLERNGVFLPDLTKGTVDDALQSGMVEGECRRLLEIRQAVSKSSTAKYGAFELRSKTDGRLRDNIVYHVASTGRFGGSGVQPHNFPRPAHWLKNTIAASETLREGDLELVRLCYKDPMEVFSSCLRNVIVAPEGKIFDIADYSQIEVRVLFWMAGDQEGVDAFKNKKKIYEEMGSQIFGIPVEQVTEDSIERFVGKWSILGAGFQMGPDRFRDSCMEQGKDISQAMAEAAIKGYRSAHKPVVAFWERINKAAIAAVQNKKSRYSVNGTRWFMDGDFLLCELPSGRCLSYPFPSVEYKLTSRGEKRQTLTHFGVDAITKKWVKQTTYGGKLVENIVQATARDIMVEAMLRIEAIDGWEIVLTVHDEIIAERDLKTQNTNQEFCRLMAENPKWADGCPIEAKGYQTVRYKK